MSAWKSYLMFGYAWLLLLSWPFFCFSSPAFGIERPTPALIEKTACTRNGVTRKVQIEYANAISKVGCEVYYDKKNEGAWHLKKLWQAEYESGYCETKAAGLINRLEGWGWECQGEIR